LHHFALAYLLHCIIFLLAHVFAYMLDHAEPESEVQEEQVLEAFKGHKRQVAWILTLLLRKESPGALTIGPCLLF
jgi:hypothetical protein